MKDLLNAKVLYPRLLWKYYFFCTDRLIARHFRDNTGKKDAVIHASFARTGNTFFRFVWLNIISLIEMGGREVDFEVLYELMPIEHYFNDIKKKWNFKSLPCLLKTHCAYSKRYTGFRAVHFFRNPLDTMISNYHYLSKRKGAPEVEGFTWIEKKVFNFPAFQGTFREYLWKNFDWYCEHFNSWMASGAVPASYDVLTGENSLQYFDKIFSDLGLKVSPEVLREAISRSRKEKLKDKPQCKKMAKLDGMHFIRNGSAGQWKELYSKKELDFVVSRLSFHGLFRVDSFPPEYKQLLLNWPTERSLESIAQTIGD